MRLERVPSRITSRAQAADHGRHLQLVEARVQLGPLVELISPAPYTTTITTATTTTTTAAPVRMRSILTTSPAVHMFSIYRK